MAALTKTVKKILLKSLDGKEFEVDEALLESQTIKRLIEDNGENKVIPLPNVTGSVLSKVIEYCRKHIKSAPAMIYDSTEELQYWDSEFLKVDQATLFALVLAAHYLGIKSLLDLTCQTVADMIKGKTPEEIKKTFNIVNEFTPEEEEEIHGLLSDFCLLLILFLCLTKKSVGCC